MSSKAKLSASTKQRKDLDSWIDALEAITINEQKWNCMVIMIIESLPEHTTCVELFDGAAENGSRKAIYPLTFKKVISNIKTLSKIDQDKLPAAQGVFHYANKLISQSNILEASLVAKLVKCLVYRAKTEVITRNKRELNHENEIDQELRTMFTMGKVESQHSMKSAKSKKSVQGVEVKPLEKTNTRLQRYGEEWRDKVYIDDAPCDGPDLYIILTGFRDPALPLELIKVGVPLNCILKIKRPNDMLDIVKNSQTDFDNNHNDPLNVTGRDFSKSDVTMKMLCDFWFTLDKSSNDPKNFDDFSSVIFRNFCPPEIPVSKCNEETELFKKDLYDRVSYIAYDLYDLQRFHINYIRSMKLVNVPTDLSKDREFNVYRRILDTVPAECTFVEVILQAMLAQVEADLQNDKPSSTYLEFESAKSKLDVGSSSSKLSTHQKSFRSTPQVDNSGDQLCNHRMRIQELNLQYSINLKDKESEKQKKEPEVILEDDEFRSKTYHVHLDNDIVKLFNPRPSSLADLAVRSLRDPRVTGLWRFHEDISEETRKKNLYHINRLTGCFGGFLDSCSLVHYLHLQVFDKMIHGSINRAATGREDRRISVMGKGCTPGAMRSEPFLLSLATVQDEPRFASRENPIFNLRGFVSDSIIDYGKTVWNTFECPELFALIDTREMLQPGILDTRNEKLCETRAAGLSVAEFADIRILSENVFLQMVHECLRKFKCFQSRYFETTDSVLLYFHTEEGTTGHSDPCRSEVIRIITPVCLRNFCEYVISEEDEWIREMEKRRVGVSTTDAVELVRKLSHHSDIDSVNGATFTDDDFILPNSLKGQARKRFREILSEETQFSKRMSKKSEADVKGKKKKNALRSSREKSSKDTKTADIESSLLSAREVPSVSCGLYGDPYKFVGYDLGNRRIQLTTHSETFTSMDGTVVQVDRDEWLYCKKRLGIGIHLSGCFLKLEHTIGNQDNDQMSFHLITKNGVVLAYTENQKLKELNPDRGPRFDFRACWPSSLLVELVRDGSFENSFYILQRYISKGPECEPVSRENYRKFLRNGTVLKFLDDDAVEVMRPNGTIVRCLKFEKFPGPRDSEFERDEELTKVSDEVSKYKKSRSLIPTKVHRKASSPKKQSRWTSQDDQNRKRLPVASPLDQITVKCCIKGFETTTIPPTELPCKAPLLTQCYKKYCLRDEPKLAIETRVNLTLVTIANVRPLFHNIPFCGKQYVLQLLLKGRGEEPVRTKITRYTALEHDGRRFEVVNDEVSRVFDASLVRTSTDFEVSEKLTRREDGMQSILNSMGELVVSFPDGTRITTGFVIETEPLICDWSDEEFNKFFENVSHRSSTRSEDLLSPHLSAAIWSGSYRSTVLQSASRIDRLTKLLDDAFVSILMTCQMEHECYTTVAYNQVDQSCKLSMPDEVVIGISRQGLYDISVGRNIELRISYDNLTYLSRFYENGQQHESTSIYYLRQPDLCTEFKRELLVTVDSLGKVFKVYADGSSVREDNTRITRNISLNPKQEQHKLFAMNRDFTAYEYLHKSKRDEYQKKMNSITRSSVISVPIPNRASVLEYRLFLKPQKPTDYSKMWLQKIPEFKVTNHNRTDLLRSTYSTPYDWLFPFGRNGNGVKKNTWNVPIGESIQEGHSGVLTLTVIQGIVEEGKNVLIELQKALSCYWAATINERGVYCTFNLENCCQCFDQSENWIRDLALGIKTNISIESYLSGLSTNRPNLKASKISRASGKTKSGQQNICDIEEMHWTKKCIREGLILPYFKNIQGSCFLLIMNCVNEALELVEN